jgi:cytochrome c556
MRRTSMLIGICVIAAMAMTLYAQTRDIQPVMKDVQPAFMSLGKNLQGNMAADAQKDAEKLQGLFKETAAFMKAQKAEKGVGWANDAATKAGDLAKAIKANDMTAAGAARSDLQKACATCHGTFREGAPGSYKFKAP